MKIQCDVCEKDEASVFCVADEAALCSACDHHVHHANKLAGKHQRFSLLQPSPKQLPLCDICQKKRGFLFCQQDRAILCKDCDIPIHKANEHTQKHNRFLLTGVKLSATSALYSTSSSSTSSESSLSDAVPTIQSHVSTKKPVSLSISVTETHTIPPPSAAKTAPSVVSSATAVPPPSNNRGGGNSKVMNGGNNSSTSSISEYLIEMLPGWHVEDFLDPSPPPPPPGFYKSGSENNELSFLDGDLESNLSAFSSENMRFWVPQAPPLYPTQIHSYPALNMAFGAPDSLKEVTNNKPSKKWSGDNSFAVPQINPPSIASKRSRTFW